MSVHIEWTSGVIRFYDGAASFSHFDPFVSVMTITKTGPEEVLLSADLSRRKLKKSDLSELKLSLLQAGFSVVFCWRKVGHRVPYNGKVVRVSGELALWEIEL